MRPERRDVWKGLLAGPSARAVLERLSDGDALRLRETVAERMMARSLIADPERVYLRALARCANDGPRYDGRPRIDEWIEGQVDRALDDWMEEAAGERAATPGRSRQSVFQAFASPLGLDPDQLARSSVDFDRAPEQERRAFFALCLEGTSIEALARREGVTPERVARRARRALTILMGADPASLPIQADESRESGESASSRRREYGT